MNSRLMVRSARPAGIPYYTRQAIMITSTPVCNPDSNPSGQDHHNARFTIIPTQKWTDPKHLNDNPMPYVSRPPGRHVQVITWNSLNPAPRNAVCSHHRDNIVRHIRPKILAETQDFTRKVLYSWRRVSPGLGKHPSEATILEPGFQEPFYGKDKAWLYT